MSRALGSADSAGEMAGLEKAPTGIAEFDEITHGGLPRGRPTLLTGAAGSGKPLFGVEFLVRGARDFGEPGVLLAFEETQDDLTTNVASLGFDLDGLFVRLAAAVDRSAASRSAGSPWSSPASAGRRAS